ncbi:MAG: hypothetical protein ACPIOQ_41005, partial [Promethearchaeia archaeon]
TGMSFPAPIVCHSNEVLVVFHTSVCRVKTRRAPPRLEHPCRAGSLVRKASLGERALTTLA